MARRLRRIKKNKISPFALNAYSILIVLVVGTLIGTVVANFLDADASSAIKSYIAGFLGNFDKTGLNYKATFINSAYRYFRVIFVIWIAGFFAPGVVLVLTLLLSKAFSYGFTTAALVKYFGLYGFIVALNSYFIQNLFYLPAIVFVSFGALAFMRSGHDDKSGFRIHEYSFTLIIGLICSAIAALIETYVTPHLITYIKPF